MSAEILPHKWQSISFLIWNIEGHVGDEKIVIRFGHIFRRIYFSTSLVATFSLGCYLLIIMKCDNLEKSLELN